jgi:type II secretory pathway pseudopilin PulG
MADMSWSSVIRNRDQYPDEMVVDMNGTPIALGELRNSVIPKEDMTKLTQGWSQRDQAARAQIETLQAQLAQALTAANTQDAAANTYESSTNNNPYGNSLVDYERDPILGPMFQASKLALERQARTDANIERLEKMLNGIGSQLGQWPVMMALDQIKRNDPYNVDPQALVQHALASRQGPPNLQESYVLLTREQREAQIRQEAEQAALAKAKLELARGQVPFQPFGLPQTMKTPEPTYASLDEAEHAAVMDPEMLAVLMGQG